MICEDTGEVALRGQGPSIPGDYPGGGGGLHVRLVTGVWQGLGEGRV